MADTTGLPWSNVPAGASDGGTGLDLTYVALNFADFDGGASCGSCIWFRGTGEAVGHLVLTSCLAQIVVLNIFCAPG